MAKVMMQVLSMSARPRLEVMKWIMEEMIDLPRHGHDALFGHICGQCMLPHARNTVVSRFMASPATDLIMIDDDNWSQVGTIAKLVSHAVDVVGAPCLRKIQGDELWPIAWHTDRPIKRETNGLIDVEHTGTGIIRLTRACLERMIFEQKARWYDDSLAGKAWPVFEFAVRDNAWYGEDVEFCQRWRDLGGKVYIDPDIKTSHVGDFEYRGSPAETLAKWPPVMRITRPGVCIKNELANP